MVEKEEVDFIFPFSFLSLSYFLLIWLGKLYFLFLFSSGLVGRLPE